MVKRLFSNIVSVLMSSILLLPVLCSCKGQKGIPYEENFTAHNDICVVVGQREMIDFSEGNLQSEYNPVTHVFRGGVGLVQEDKGSGMQVETVQEYFVVVLDANPSAVGDQLKGSLILRSSSLNRVYTASFKVVKLTETLAWLWDDNIKLGAVVKVGAEQ